MTKKKRLRHNEYYNMQEIYDNLYKDSSEGKIFTNLIDLIRKPENIVLAYRNIKRNNGSTTSGTDDKTIKDIEQLPQNKYVEIVQKKLDYYKPKPVKRVEIPKPNGKTRPLGIPTIIDRLVQQSILQVLEPICEPKFHERSNGFRPNRSAENAIAQCYKMIQKQNLHFVVDIDIKGFFDNVNHAKLIKQMWTLGIRDKKLLSIIKEMLKAPIVMPDGTIQHPTCGTPQGGILSPLLSNIVLNELDWWISSQWETQPTCKEYKCEKNKNGTTSRGSIYRALRKSNLKEMYIVRYADDFKIFCRKRSDANRVFYAAKLWLNDRLKLQISEEKSKVVNLKRRESEFLGFKLKAVKKGEDNKGKDKYVVESHMSDKAIKRETLSLIEQIKHIQKPQDSKQGALATIRYNQMVEGIQNYYRIATHINIDCTWIQRRVSTVLKNRLGKRLKRKGEIGSPHIKERYGKSQQLRFVDKIPLVPIGYVQTKNPMYKKKSICNYTSEGRAEIHKSLQLDPYVLRNMRLMALPQSYSSKMTVEYIDNRISKYVAQYGKCAVLGNILSYDEIHCHHKKPKKLGGNDRYQNLIIVHKDVHELIHATKPETISKYLESLNLNTSQLKMVNSLRKNVNNEPITIN